MALTARSVKHSAAWYPLRLDESLDNRAFLEREIRLTRTAADRAEWESELFAIDREIATWLSHLS